MTRRICSWPRTTLVPTEVAQTAHRYSYLSPSGSTRRRRFLTGIERLQFGQKSSVASNSLNVSVSAGPLGVEAGV
jgi:hypothetical protein